MIAKLNRLGENSFFATNLHLIQCRERSGSVVKCLSIADLRLNGVNALLNYTCSVLVQSRHD